MADALLRAASAASLARDCNAVTQRLYIAGKFTGVTLRTDAEWPVMWRVHHGDRVSDIINATRAKDAAIAWARPRGLGGGEAVRWHHRETASEAPPVRGTLVGVS